MQRVRCRALDDRIGAPEQTRGLVETALVADLEGEFDHHGARALGTRAEHTSLDVECAAKSVLGTGEILRAVVESAESHELGEACEVGAAHLLRAALEPSLDDLAGGCDIRGCDRRARALRDCGGEDRQ